MASGPSAPADEPPKRRDSWSLRKIAEEIGGRPISDFQDPSAPHRPGAPAWSVPRARLPPPARRGSMGAPEPEEAREAEAARSPAETAELDPVDRVYPPLSRALGRRLHGEANEHHAETLGRHATSADPPSPGERPHPPGPSTRPERIYLHYLLLHLDRLSDHALSYLGRAVSEEVEHREAAESAARRA